MVTGEIRARAWKPGSPDRRWNWTSKAFRATPWQRGAAMAENALERWRTRLTFVIKQSSRVAWYAGHGAVMRRMVERLEAKAPGPKRRVNKPKHPVPPMRRLL